MTLNKLISSLRSLRLISHFRKLKYTVNVFKLIHEITILSIPANCHTFGFFFTHFWPDKWVCHSFTHCHTICRFATHFHSYRKFWIQNTDFEKNWLAGLILSYWNSRFFFIVEHIPSWADADETNINEIAPKLRRNFTSMMLDYLWQNGCTNW